MPCASVPLQLPSPPCPRLSSPIVTPASVSLTNTSASSSGPLTGDVVKWTSCINRLARRGCLADASAEFFAMLNSSTSPNHVTILTLLSACADFPSSPHSFPLGVGLHALALKLSFFSSDQAALLLGTSLIGFYSNTGFPYIARQLFDRMSQRNSVTYSTMITGYMKNAGISQALDLFHSMPERNLVSWTAIIDGCVKNGLADEALELFGKMQDEGVDPDYVAAISAASACADLGALGHGMWLHHFAFKRGMIANVRFCNSLIDMYSRCGRVDFARQVFDEMSIRTLVSWNCMIVGLANNGCSSEALVHFSELCRSELKPDCISFTGALAACSHAGLVGDGLRLYQSMQIDYGIKPSIEHYGCLVDLLGRAGLLEEALSLVESMPMKPNEVVLGSLLSACRVHGYVSLAERLMAVLVRVEPKTDSNYVLLSNIYAAIGWWDRVGKVRGLMRSKGVKRRPGFSSVEVGCSVHHFMAGDGSHPMADQIHALLALLHVDMELHGYKPSEGAAGESD
ncbi:hypothetical protein HPP92_011328 [Vanilla planifolia]|uniref:Pentatricopeptide repeat-containing protein n=1 Tax=Vanilla planifolia TaxID=51239 RepID=A0A835QVH2_VANPL|nr:hypothetical protein HPP92_011328 [Vanilla planifolia]